MAHLHCIEHGRRVTVVEYDPTQRVPGVIFGFKIRMALHRNGGKSAERCNSMLRIGTTNGIKVSANDVGQGILTILNGHRLVKPKTSS